jgi:spermidine synthase
LLNASAGFVASYLLRGAPGLPRRRMRRARWRAGLVFSGLLVAFICADDINRYAESLTFDGTVVSAESSEYQRSVLVRRGQDHEFYLNGHLQFSSRDEHRYHEALVHPAMAAVKSPRRVLIGGGGDGLAVREVLRWPSVESVHLVDLDPMVTRLAQQQPVLLALNSGALSDRRVTVFNEDAMLAFRQLEPGYDVIILDFPDPSTYSLGKLYSLRFYRQVRRLLAKGGALSVQSTSPQLANRSFWCVVATLEKAGLKPHPYHAFLPSFGDWGYVLGTKQRHPSFSALPSGLKYLDDGRLEALFKMPKDMQRPVTDINRLGSQALVSYYLDEWGALN